MASQITGEHCDVCNLTFDTDADLKLHLQQKHMGLLDNCTSPEVTGTEARNSFKTSSKELIDNSSNTVKGGPICHTITGQVLVRNSFNTTSEEQIRKDENSLSSISSSTLDEQCFSSETSKGLSKASVIKTETDGSLGISTSPLDQHLSSNNSLTTVSDKKQLGYHKNQEKQNGNSAKVVNKIAANPCYKKLVSFYKENSSIPRFSMFPCSDCSAHFVDSISRQIHVMQVHPNLLFSCEMCHKLFVTNGEKTRHIKTTHGKIAFIHDVNGTLRFRCKICNEAEFDSFEEFVSHSPCPFGASEKTVKYTYKLNTLEQKMKHNFGDGLKERGGSCVKTNKRLAQDENEGFSFDFLDDSRMSASYSSSELQEKLVRDDQVVMSEGYDSNQILTSDVSPGVVSAVDSSVHNESELAMSVCDSNKAMIGVDSNHSVIGVDSNHSMIGVDSNHSMIGVDSNHAVIEEDSNHSMIGVDSNHAVIEDDSNHAVTEVDSNHSIIGVDSNHAVIGVDTDSNHSMIGVESNHSMIGVDSNHSVIGVESNHSMIGVDSNHSVIGVDSNQAVTEVDSNHSMIKIGAASEISTFDLNESDSEIDVGTEIDYYENTSSTMLLHSENKIKPFAVQADKTLNNSHCLTSRKQTLNNSHCLTSRNQTLNNSHCSTSRNQTLNNSHCSTSRNQTLNNSHCSTSRNQTSECEQSSNTEAYEPEESYHFTEGGESWTISRNVEHDDTETTSEQAVEDHHTEPLLSESCVKSLLKLEPTDTMDTDTTYVGGLVQVTETVCSEADVDFESCSLCYQVFDSCLQLKQHISLWHKENLNETTNENLNSSFKTGDVYNEQLHKATDINHDPSLKSCDHYKENLNSETYINHESLLKSCDLYNVNLNEATSLNLDNSLETCDLCNESFQNVTQMKEHIKFVHCEKSELSTSSQIAAEDDEPVPLFMQVMPACKYVDEDTDNSEVGFVENRMTQIKTELCCEETSEQNVQVESDMLRNVSILRGLIEKKVNMDESQSISNTNVKDSCKDKDLRDVDAGPRKKRTCVKMKTRSSYGKPMRQHSLEDDVPKEEKRVKRKYVKKRKSLFVDIESTEQISVDESNIPKKKKRLKRWYGRKKVSMNVEKKSTQVSGDMTKGNNSEEYDLNLGKVGNVSTNAKLSSQNTCRHCDESFDKKSMLVKHMVSEHPEYLRRCDLCSKVFPYAFLKRKHMEKCHSAEPVVPVSIVKSSNHDLQFQCPQCPERLADKEAMTMHNLVRHSRNYMYYPCELCDKVFAYPGLKRKHMAMVHFVMECNFNNATKAATQAMILSFNSPQTANEEDLNTDTYVSGAQCLADTVTMPSVLSVSGSANTLNTVSSVDDSPVSPSSIPSSASGLPTNASSISPIYTSLGLGIPTNTSPIEVCENNLPSGQSLDTTDRVTINIESPMSLSSKIVCKDLVPETSCVTDRRSKSVTNLTLFPCKFCHEEFHSLTKLANHAISQHSGVKPLASQPSSALFPCKFCDKEFSSLTKLGYHATSFHRKDMPFAQYPCECGRLFTTTSGLAQHLRLTCRLNNESKSAVTESKSAITESKSAVLESSPEVSESKSKVSKSKSIVSESKSLTTRSRSLTSGSQSVDPESRLIPDFIKSVKPIHVQTGVSVNGRLKPFSCQFCDHWFLSPAHLQNHALRSHPSSLSRARYPCHCGDVFGSVKDLERHQLKHIQELTAAHKTAMRKTSEQKHEQELFKSVLRSVFEGKQNEFDSVEEKSGV